MDILSELTQLKADYSAAQSLLEEARAAKANFDTTLAAKDAEIKAAQDQIAAKGSALAAKDAELEALRAEIADLKTKQKTATEAAIEIVASQGIAPIASAPDQEEQELTRPQAIAKYGSLKGKEQADFYKAHRALLTGK